MTFVPTGTYWRDSGEFILSAYFLDIAHPAGFPLFSQLANLGALLPLGPIAWRVNSFNCLIGCLNLLLIFLLTSALLERVDALPKFARALLSLIPILILISTQAFLRQSFTVEVYNLNTFFILVLVLLYQYYEQSGDKRYVILCGFIAGLGLGNHAALAFVLLPAVFIICSDWKVLKNIFVPTLIAGLTGILIYAYIPTRATQNLPLNTGQANSLSRFWNQISDARDRTLRKIDPGAIDSSIVHLQAVTYSAILSNVRSDLRTMNKEVGFVVLIVGVLGLILLILRRPRLGLLITTNAAATWLFFLGWDSDPWLPLFASIGIGCAYLLAAFTANFFPDGFKSTAFSLIALTSILTLTFPARASEKLQKIRNFNLPSDVAIRQMQNIPYQSIYITEASWFLLNYMQNIEGYRDDIRLAYQPSILFPDYFTPIKLSAKDGSSFESGLIQFPPEFPGEPHEAQLSAFTDYVAKRESFGFEPNMLLNHFFSPVIQCRADGYAFLVYGKAAQCVETFADAYVKYLQFISQAAVQSWPGFQADTEHFFEAQLTNAADLFRKANSPKMARELLEKVCLGEHKQLCKLTALNNLATYYMDEGDNRSAAILLLKLYDSGNQSSSAVRKNLALTLKGLEDSVVQELLKDRSLSVRRELISAQ